MGKKTTKKSETDAEGRKKMVEAAVDLLQGKYADLPGNDQKKCRDEALLEDVRVKMGWDYAPGSGFLFDEVRDHRERAEAPEQEKPKRRAPTRRRSPSPSPPPPAKRSEPTPAPAKPAPLAEQDLNEGQPCAATAEASSELAQFRAAVELAEKARTGEKVVLPGSGGLKACEVRLAGEGDDKWRPFKTRKDAAAAFPGLTAPYVSQLCNNTATSAVCAKWEARDVDEGASISKAQAYVSLLSGAGFRFNNANVGSDADALAVVQRGGWKVVDLPPPQSWEDALKSMGEFNESQLRNFAAATAEAEAARVDQARTAHLASVRPTQILSRRAAAAAGARETEEAHNELVEEEIFDEGGLREIKVDADNLELFLKDHEFRRDDEEVWVKYKDKWVILKAGPWPKRYAFGSPGSALCVAAARVSRGPIGETVATLRRLVVGEAIAMTRAAADCTEGWAHAGRQGRWALTATPRPPGRDHARGLDFDPVEAMGAIGLSLLRETPATQDDGEPLDGGFFKCRFALDATVGTWGAFATESDRLRDRLLRTSPDDRRLDAFGAVASYRRNTAGAAEPGTVALWLSTAHRATGPSPHWTALHNFLSREGFPIYAELMRRGNKYCVPLEFLAYRDPTKGGPFHVDAATLLLLSKGGQTSATMAEA